MNPGSSKLTLISIFTFLCAITILYGQTNELIHKDSLRIKYVVTEYDTLEIEIGKKYFDYFDSCQANFSLYRKFLEQGMPDKALNVNDKLIIKYPYYDLPYCKHGIILLESYKEYKKAIKWFEIAAELNPTEGFYYSNLGLCYLHLKDAKKAIEYYSRAIDLTFRISDSYYMRANAKELNNDLAGAIDDYEHAILYDSKSSKSYNNIAFIYITQGDYKKALKAGNSSLKINPESSNAYYNRGIAKYKLGDYEGACQDWQNATKYGSDATKYTNLYCK